MPALLGLSGHSTMSHLMSLSGVKRTSAPALHMSAFDPKRTLGVLFAVPYFSVFLTLASAEQGLSFEQASPITPTAWISISIPGLAKFVTVIRALPG
jgi:hypothetical protein